MREPQKNLTQKEESGRELRGRDEREKKKENKRM